MEHTQFIWVAVVIGVFLTGLFVVRRNAPQPSRLKMTAARPTTRLEPRPKAMVTKVPKQKGAALANNAQRKARHLNVHFNYNGHSWDAFEVLGIPAGCSWDEVENAYARAKAQADRQSHEFLEMAWLTIQMHYDERNPTS